MVDLSAGRIHAVVSTEAKDRQGDIIRQAGWDLTNFQSHPILLSSHNYGTLLSHIGEWEDMAVNRKRLEGTARYYIGEGNAEADWAFNLAKKGRGAYSVGFIPDMAKAKRLESEEGEEDWFGSWEFNGQELLEVSHVTVPANPEALQQMKGLQGLHPVMAQVIRDVLEDVGVGEATADGLTAGAKALIAEIVKELRKDAQSDMSDMKQRMEQMRDSMDGMATMMGDMMDEMKGAAPKRGALGKDVHAAIEQAMREAILKC